MPKHRCDRLQPKQFGDEDYCREELIAEIAACMLCAELDITADIRADHSAYIKHWYDVMDGDPKAIFAAAARASEAVAYLNSLQPDAAAVTPDHVSDDDQADA